MKLWLLTSAIISLNLSACAQEAPPEGAVISEQATFRVETVAEGLEHPWSLAFLPGGDFLITERAGTLYHISADGSIKTPITGLPGHIHAAGQAGLFDVTLSPRYAQNNVIYLSYSGADGDVNNTEVAHGILDLDNHTLSDVQVIFKATPKVKGNNHYGGRLLFGPDEKLYITLGERFDYLDQVQKAGNHLGTLVRLNADGSVPDDNPFAKGDGAKPADVFTYGHRNVQGIARRPGTQEIWTHEHGPKGGDEINILKAGANYGWPAITFGVDYSGFEISDKTAAPGMEQPLLHWTPSIAPSGMAFYEGDAFPQWRGDLFVGALAGTHLRRLEISGEDVTEQEILLPDMARIRDVRSGPDGFIYLLTDESEGRLIRLRPVE